MTNSLSTGMITGPSMISYIDQLSLPDYDDMADCVAIAKASADIVADRFKNVDAWLEEYAFTLDFLGWELYKNAITTRTATNISGSIADFLVQSADNMKNPRQANAMIDTMDALKPNKTASTFYDNETLMGEHFQIIPAQYDAKGTLWLAIYDLNFVSRVKSGNFLFFKWADQTTSVTQRHAYFKRNQKKVEDNRELIEEKLRGIAIKRFNLAKNKS